MVTLINVIIWCCTPAVLNDERGSLRSRSAAAVSSLTLRQISAVLPPERAWGLWLSRQIVARIMDVVPVDTRTSDGRRVVGKWVYGVGVPRDQADTAIYFVHGSGYALCSPRTHRRLTSWLPDRTAGVQCRLSAGTTPSIPQRRRRCPIRLGLAHP
jgi:epsilon-lactone hydrolase